MIERLPYGREGGFHRLALRAGRGWLWPLLVALSLLASLAWRLPNLEAFSLSNDEGAYLMWAWLVHSGHPLYTETLSVSAPGLIVLLDWAFGLGGVSLVTGRLLVLGFTGLGMLAMAWLTAQLRRGQGAAGLAALVALVVFSLSPMAFSLSRMVMGEIPALALAVLAVACAAKYAEQTQVGALTSAQGWLVLSGLAFSLSLLVKALNPLLVLPILALVVLSHAGRPPGWRRLGLALLVWVLVAAVPVVICLLIYDPVALYDQVVAFRWDLRQAFPWQPAQNLVWLRYFAQQHWGVLALAGAGLLLTARQHSQRRAFGVMTLWLIASLATVLTHSPLFPHHTVILLPPLVILAGLAMGEAWSLCQARRWAWGSLGWLAGVVLLLSAPEAVQANQTTLAASFGREADAIAFLQQVTRPGDRVISDNLLLAFLAGRQTPPPLGDVAQVAIASGRQTSERLIALSQNYPVEAVADWALRLPYLSGYMDWVRQNFLARRVWDDHHVIYFGRKVGADQVPNRQRIHFQDGISLLGFEALRPDAGPSSGGDTHRWLRVTLFWSASGRPSRDYTVFVHLYDAAGQLVASHDGTPVFGYLPTRQWPEAEVVPDRHDVRLPDELPAGSYRLAAGLYDPANGQRLAVVNEVGIAVDDKVELEHVLIR